MKPSYKLKPGCENFTIMSGADAGQTFTRGRAYDAVPAGYDRRFAKINAGAGRKKGQPQGVAPTKTENPEPAPAKAPAVPVSQVNAGKKTKKVDRLKAED